MNTKRYKHSRNTIDMLDDNLCTIVEDKKMIIVEASMIEHLRFHTILFSQLGDLKIYPFYPR